jgi:hypothetical protein
MQLKTSLKQDLFKKSKGYTVCIPQQYTVYIPQHSTGIRRVNRIQCNPETVACYGAAACWEATARLNHIIAAHNTVLCFWRRQTRTHFRICYESEPVISGSLSQRHGASPGCGWRNGLQYGGWLRVYWISSRRQPTRGCPLAWGWARP